MVDMAVNLLGWYICHLDNAVSHLTVFREIRNGPSYHLPGILLLISLCQDGLFDQFQTPE